jgi:hypothetical protein
VQAERQTSADPPGGSTVFCNLSAISDLFQLGRGAKELIMGLILLIILILLLLGAVPSWPYSRNWGYGPSGLLGLLLVVLLVLLIFDVVRFTI